jgi:hypothetical protein
MIESCRRCQNRTDLADFVSSRPKCGFLNGVFHAGNWNCVTLGELRLLVEDEALRRNDQSAAILSRSDGAYLVLSWYKNRGRTEGAWTVLSASVELLTLREAEGFLDEYRERLQELKSELVLEFLR